MTNLIYLGLICNQIIGKVFVILFLEKPNKVQYTFRFFASWIISAAFMYVAFYFWHGIFLNDLERINFSKTLFLVLAALVYLVISYLVYRTFETRILQKYISSPVFRGVFSGVLVGFVLFATVTVLGISFTKHLSFKYLVADCAWQIVEQVIGGIMIAIGKIVIMEHEPEPARNYLQ